MHSSALLLLLLLSIRCLAFHTPCSQHPRALCTTATAEHGGLTFIPLSFFLRPPRICFKPKRLFPSLLLLLCVDISLNPGPVSATHSNLHIPLQPSTHSSHHATRSSNKKFLLHSLNIRSLLNPKNSIVLSDLASCSRPPDLIALQETWISTSSTSAHIADSKPPGYSLSIVSLAQLPPQSLQKSLVAALPSWSVNRLSS